MPDSGTAEESNRRYRYLLSQGTTGLSVAFDLPTQMGYDSDHPLASGEVGRVGVAISSLADMQTLFREIPLRDVSTSMTINSTAAILLACYAQVASRQGADRKRLSGTVQNDILKEYIARGTYIYPPRPAMRIVTDIFAWAGARDAGVEHHLDQRLSHPRSRLDRRSGTGLHLRQRHRLYRGGHRGRVDGGFLRAPALLFLQLAQRFSGGNRQVPRRAPHLRALDARPLRRPRPALRDAALSRADRRLAPLPRSSPT